MCGITGFIDFNKKSSKEILLNMCNALGHRGPDGEGDVLFDTNSFQVGLAHRRLAIIDLSVKGKQPMRFLDLSITFNGEIYNFKEIRLELEKLGHSFTSNTDTEVILQAYSKWGIDCINRFTGMFAFVIYDRKNQEIICVRDRAGVKPLYYYLRENLFLFASELKSFHQHPGFRKELNVNAVGAFMQFGNVPAPHCIFQHTFKLPPGHYLRFKAQGQKPEKVCYWNVYDSYNKPKLDISFAEAKKETTTILHSAFNYRMVSDVPVGIFLSGGYDSACLTSLLQKNRPEKLKTFTIGVPDIGLDEAPYAKAIAAHLGTEHHEVYCTGKEALEHIFELPYFYDEPFGDHSAIPTSLVCKIARQHVTVALSADGGDEVFAGYNRYDYLMKYGKLLGDSPEFIRKSLAGLMDRIPAEKIPFMRKKYNFFNRYEKLKNLLSDPSPNNMMLSLSKQFSDKDVKNLFKNGVKSLNTAYMSHELKKEFYTPLSYMMAIDYQTYLADDILQKVDRASMSYSLEAREPFLDHKLIEWVAQLPDNFKYHNGTKKYILKEIVHQFIPKKLIDRPKMGFAIPIEQWLCTDLKTQVLYYLSEDKIITQGIFNPAPVKNIINAFYSGHKEYTLKVWYLLMFQMWYERWMN